MRIAVLLSILLAGISNGFALSPLEGTWTLLPEKSTEIDLFGTLSIRIEVQGPKILFIHEWGSGRSYIDTLTAIPDSTIYGSVKTRICPTNVFMGVSMEPETKRSWTGRWIASDAFEIGETHMVRTSQGTVPCSSIHSYTLGPEELLTYSVRRTGRGEPLIFTLKRQGFRHAVMMTLPDDWSLDGGLKRQVFLISLQGIVNRREPKLYFVYPETWDFRFTPGVLEYLKHERNFTFSEIRTPEQALSRFLEDVRGYVLWDPDVRTSLIVAFTIAGLESAVVATEDMIPWLEQSGLSCIQDLRGILNGMNDHEIYSWAYGKFWDLCSKEMIVWMGGEHGKIVKPGVADWGIKNCAFFQDLSTLPSDTAEYRLASRLLSELNPNALVFGWHSYKKDKERDHVSLTSRYGHRVEGLHTLPNLSFSSQIPLTPGFKFKNNHNLVPGKSAKPGKTVYISCIQTDCLGLGAWTRPGRGQIPYAWEVTMNWVWLAPAMLEFFYSQATPNDFFIGALSGPGYLYPKAVPEEQLPSLIEKARDLMDILDLNVFEIMDYSEGATIEGNTELTEKIVSAYYQGMPDAIGFVNGYAPSFTFTSRDGRPWISYDYYLSPTKPESEAVLDIKELAALNRIRPYFLLIHVRQWSDISRVKNILDQLGPGFEVVPLDVFLQMAGQNPTFKQRFLEHR